MEHGYATAGLAGLKEYFGDPDAIVDFVGGATVFVTHLAPLSAGMLERLPALKLVAVSRGGPVNIDMTAARARGVTVELEDLARPRSGDVDARPVGCDDDVRRAAQRGELAAVGGRGGGVEAPARARHLRELAGARVTIEGDQRRVRHLDRSRSEATSLLTARGSSR